MKGLLQITLLTLLLGVAGWAQAQEVRVGVIDMRKVLNESKAGQRVRADIEKMAKQRQDALDKEEKQLENMKQAYEKEKLLLSEAQKQAKQKEMETKAKAAQQAYAQAQRDLQKQEADFMQKIEPDVRAIIDELAKQQKLSIVFERGLPGLLYAADVVDLTGDVLKRLDAKTGG